MRLYNLSEEDDFFDCWREEKRMIVMNEKILEIEKMTGGILLELKILEKFLSQRNQDVTVDTQVRQYQGTQLQNYKNYLEIVFKKLDDEEKSEFCDTLLKFFNLRFHGLAENVHRDVYDSGLLYKKDFNTQLFIINEAAKRVFMSMLNKVQIQPISIPRVGQTKEVG